MALRISCVVVLFFTQASVCIGAPNFDRVTLTAAGYGGGGRFTAVEVHPKNPDTVFVGSDVAGVFKSEDGGNHFRLLGRGLKGFAVADIAIHPITDNWLFLLTDQGLFFSDDLGETFRLLSGEIRYSSRFSGSRLLVFSRCSLWAATDKKGVFQVSLTTPKPVVTPISGLEHTKINGLAIYNDRLFAASQDGVHLYDGGKWRMVIAGLLPEHFNITDIDAGRDNRLFIVEKRKGLFEWIKKENRWDKRDIGLMLMAQLKPKAYKALAVHPFSSDRLFMATDPEIWPYYVFFTPDGGRSWNPVDSFIIDENASNFWAVPKTVSSVEKIAFSFADPKVLYLLDWWNVWKSIDEGKSWHQLHEGLQNTVVNDIKVHPVNQSEIYICAWDNGLMRSTDGGKSWSRAMTGVLDGHAQELEISTRNPNNFFLLTNPWHKKDKIYVYKSLDGARTWQDIGFPVPKRTLPSHGFVSGMATNLEVDPYSDDVLYVATNGYGIFKTIDGGKTWKEINSGLKTPFIQGPDALLIHPKDNRILFASTQQGGVYRSMDAGANWRQVENRHSFTFGMAIDPSNHSRILVAAEKKTILISQDMGNSWQESVLPGKRPDYLATHAVSIHPLNPDIVFAGTLAYNFLAADGLYASSDGGRNFQWIQLNLPGISINDICIEKRQDIGLYIGYSGIGAFHVGIE